MREISREKLDRLYDLVEKLHIATSSIDHPCVNIWASTDYREWQPGLERNLLDRLQQTEKSCVALDMAARSIGSLLNLPINSWSRRQYEIAADAVNDLIELLSLTPPSLLRTTDYSQLSNTIREWTCIGRKRDQLRIDVIAHFSEHVLSLDLITLQKEVMQATTTWLTPELIADNDNASATDWIQLVELKISSAISKLQSTAQLLLDNSKIIIKYFGIAGDSLSISGYESLDKLCDLMLYAPNSPPVTLINEQEWQQLRSTIQRWISNGRLRDHLREELLARSPERPSGLDWDVIYPDLKEATNSWLTVDLISKSDNTKNWIQWIASKVQSSISLLLQATEALLEGATCILPLIGINDNELSIYGFTFLVKLCELFLCVPPALPSELVISQDWEATRLSIQGWIEHGRRRDSLRASLYGRYTEQIVKLNLDELHQKLVAAKVSWVIPRIYGCMSVHKIIRGVSRTGSMPTIDQLLTDIEQAIELRAENEILSKVSGQASTLLKFHWKNGEADWMDIEQLIEWSSSLRNLIAIATNSDKRKATALRASLAIFLRDNRERCISGGDIGKLFQDLREAFVEFIQAYGDLKTILSIDLTEVWGKERFAQPKVIASYLQEWLKHIEALLVLAKGTGLSSPLTFEKLLHYLQIAEVYQSISKLIDDMDSDATYFLEHYWNHGEADWNSIEHLVEWNNSLKHSIIIIANNNDEESSIIRTSIAKLLCVNYERCMPNGDIGEQFQIMRSSYAKFMSDYCSLKELMNIDMASIWGNKHSVRLEAVIDHLKEWQRQIAALHKISDVAHVGAIPSINNITHYLILPLILWLLKNKLSLSVRRQKQFLISTGVMEKHIGILLKKF